MAVGNLVRIRLSRVSSRLAERLCIHKIPVGTLSLRRSRGTFDCPLPMKWLGPFLSAKNSLASFRFALRSHSLICFTVILLIWFLQSRSSAWSRLFHCGVATSSACCCGDIGVWVSPRSCRHASCTRVSLSPPFTSRSADSTRQRFRRSRCCSALRYGRRGVCSRWLSGIVFSPAALLAPSICLRSKSLSPAPCCSRSEL